MRVAFGKTPEKQEMKSQSSKPQVAGVCW